MSGRAKHSHRCRTRTRSPRSAARLHKGPKQTCSVASVVESAGGVDVRWSVEAHLEPRLCLLHVIRQHPTGGWGWWWGVNDFHLTGPLVCVFEPVSEGRRGVTLLRSRAVSLRSGPSIIRWIISANGSLSACHVNFRRLRWGAGRDPRNTPPRPLTLPAEVISASSGRQNHHRGPGSSCWFFEGRRAFF